MKNRAHSVMSNGLTIFLLPKVFSNPLICFTFSRVFRKKISSRAFLNFCRSKNCNQSTLEMSYFLMIIKKLQKIRTRMCKTAKKAQKIKNKTYNQLSLEICIVINFCEPLFFAETNLIFFPLF